MPECMQALNYDKEIHLSGSTELHGKHGMALFSEKYRAASGRVLVRNLVMRPESSSNPRLCTFGHEFIQNAAQTARFSTLQQTTCLHPIAAGLNK